MASSRSSDATLRSVAPTIRLVALAIGGLVALYGAGRALSSAPELPSKPATSVHRLRMETKHTERIAIKGGSLVETVTVHEEAHYTKE